METYIETCIFIILNSIVSYFIILYHLGEPTFFDESNLSPTALRTARSQRLRQLCRGAAKFAGLPL